MTLPRPSVRSAMMWVAERISSTDNSATGARAWACRSRAPGPVQAPLQIDVLKVVFDKFTNPRAAVDMRYDLQEEIWRLERGLDGGVIGRLVLVPHGPGRHPRDRNRVCRPGCRFRHAETAAPISLENPKARVRRRSADRRSRTYNANSRPCGRERTPGSPGRFRCNRQQRDLFEGRAPLRHGQSSSVPDCDATSLRRLSFQSQVCCRTCRFDNFLI
jgi:hypothetical protein